MKKILTSFLVVCLILTGLSVLPVVGEDESKFRDINERSYQSRSGTRKILYVGAGQTYTKIQDAVNASKSGDTIRVFAGTYYESINVNKRLYIIGNDTSNTSIYSNSNVLFTITSNFCKIDEFNLTGNQIGILVKSDNIMIGNISCWNTKNNGIILYKSQNSRIHNFTSYRNANGIYLKDSNFTEIINANCSNNLGHGIFLDNSNNNIIKTSDFNYNKIRGIQIQNGNQNTIIKNIFKDNYLELIQINSSCQFNYLHNNDFINSSGSVIVKDNGNYNQWNTTSFGNFWSNWTSPDNNGDGIVDKPFTIKGSANAKDYLPLTQPTNKVSSNIKPRGSVFIVRTGKKYSTIHEAVDDSIPGDTIRIWSGIFLGGIYLNKSLTLVGNGTDHTKIVARYGGVDYNFNSLIRINADDCTIKNIRFDGTRINFNVQTGIHCNRRGNTIEDCIITNNDGGLVTYGDNHIIKNCTFINNDNSGIYCYSHLTEITNSNFKNSDYGVFLREATFNIIRECNFTKNYRGIYFYWKNYNNTILNCNIKDNLGTGIYFYVSHNNTICGNTIGEQGIGIILWNAINNTFVNNNIFNHSNYGMKLNEKSIMNSIYNNNIINNYFPYKQAIDNGTNNKWNSSIHGNFWSDWITPDSDSDGIVDFPYNISGEAGNKDYYPLTKPVNEIEFAPILETTNVLNAYEGILYSVNYTASDIDTAKNDLLWTMKTNASWLNFSQGQMLFGTPTNDSIGTFWVKIVVTDGNNSDSTNFSITVYNVNQTPPSTYAPIITNTNILFTYVGNQYLVNYTVTDLDTPQQNLTWSMKTNASWLTFSSNQELSGTPSESDIGTHWVYIAVTDGENIDSTNFTLAVIKLVKPPIPKNGSVIIIRTGERFTKIQDAIDNASYKDTIKVYSGTFNENIKIDKTLTIIGNGSNNSIVKGVKQGPVVTVNAHRCSIEQLNIKHNIPKGYISSGILINYEYNNVNNCTLNNNARGILIESNHNLIKHCTLSDNSYEGIRLKNSTSNNTIFYNTVVRNGGFGIRIDFYGNNNSIHHNNLINNTLELQSYSIQAFDDGSDNEWNTNSEGNYWSDWTSPDNNKDGIVDKPYVLGGMANSNDYYPLTTMVGETAPSTPEAPKITTINVFNATVGKQYMMNYTASDIDTPIKNLIWSMRTNASWLNFSLSQLLYGTPSSSDIGSYWVFISVSDGSNSDSTNFTIIVMEDHVIPEELKPVIKNTNIEDNSQNVSINTTEIVIEFSQPINRTSVEAALTISPSVNYSLVWEKNNTVLKIIFLEDLSYDTEYSITIGSSAKAYDGTGFDKPFELVFTTERSESKDDFPSVDDGEWGIVIILAIVSVVTLILIFLLILSLITKNRRKHDEYPVRIRYEHEPEGITVTNGLDEEIYELKKSALGPQKPSKFGLSKQELVNKFKKKYEKGGISKETYEMIKESLKNK